jgi:hypothetical protein
MLDLNLIESQLRNSRTGLIRATKPKDPVAGRVFGILKGEFLATCTATTDEMDAAKALGSKLGVYSPRTGRAGMDVWLEGDVVKHAWYGMPGSGSLLGIMLPGNADAVNRLDVAECLAVYLSVQHSPWASNQAEVYKRTLKAVRNGSAFKAGTMPELKLGDLRMLILKRAGSGINAPSDLYLKAAVDAQTKP